MAELVPATDKTPALIILSADDESRVRVLSSEMLIRGLYWVRNQARKDTHIVDTTPTQHRCDLLKLLHLR